MSNLSARLSTASCRGEGDGHSTVRGDGDRYKVDGVFLKFEAARRIGLHPGAGFAEAALQLL